MFFPPSPTGLPSKVPHVFRKGRSWRGKQGGSRGWMLHLLSATFITSIIKKRSFSPETDTEVCTDEEHYSRTIRCCQSFSPLCSFWASHPAAVGMLVSFLEQFWRVWGLERFSFQADGRDQGVAVLASLWKVNRKQNYKHYTLNNT